MRSPWFFPAFAVLVACSSSSTRPADAPAPSTTSTSSARSSSTGASRASTPDVKAEVGALDASAVGKNFTSLQRQADRCQDDRRKQNDRLDFLAGDLTVEVRVGEDGSVKSAALTRSTLGDRVVEKCIVDAARAMTWPRPQGGLTGIASNELSLPMKGDREAVPWPADKVTSALSRAQSALAACKSPGAQITAYVGTDGHVIAAGASQPDPTQPSAPDCLVDAIKGLTFPSPGGWPARVTFAAH